ncbi:ricin-type beta-trefoil lectin domain protein [Micromonosporaceae bacterium Da 78-11]
MSLAGTALATQGRATAVRKRIRRLGALVAGLGVAAAITVTAVTAHAESNGGVRIMPLGDSITDGFTVSGGYRTVLWQRFANVGQAVDFTGSAYGGPDSLGDRDHEGHSSWRIRDIDNMIAGWLRTSAPRTVLLQIGTNDINGNEDVGNAPARLSALIDTIRTNSPAVELFVAQLTPLVDPVADARVQVFNAALPGVVAQKGPRTHLVDMHSALTTSDIADGIHPTAAGYDKMAARWYEALRSVPTSLEAAVVAPVDSPVLLSNPQSNRCLDIAGGATGDGAAAVIWDCHARVNQRWTRTAAGELRVYGDRCLDVNANGTADGTRVQLWTCNNTPAQRFTFTAAGAVVAAGSGKCLDVDRNGTENGTTVQLWNCNNSGAQRWFAR